MSEPYKIIENLKKKYKNDAAAIAEINAAIETIKYYENQGNADKAMSEAKQLESFLGYWY